MSGGGGNPAQSSTTQISPQAQSLFNTAFPALQEFAANPPKAYPTSTVAPTNVTQQEGQQQVLQGAGAAGDIADWSRVGVAGIPAALSQDIRGQTPYAPGSPLNLSSDPFNNPGVWNTAFNPGLEAAITAAQRPTWQQLTETALPAIRGSFGPGPQSTRQGIAEGLATSRANQQALDTAAKMAEDVYGQNLGAVQQRYATNVGAEGQRYGQDVGAETARYGTDIGAQNQRYGQNVNAMLAAYGLAPSLQQQQLLGGLATTAVGDVQQQQAQAELTDLVNRTNYNQLAPYLAAKEITSLIPGLPGATTFSTGNTPQTNPATMALGGAGTGAALGGALGSIIPGMGTGIGALAGGGIGATLPFLFNR